MATEVPTLQARKTHSGIPGSPVSAKDAVLEAGAAATQSFEPLKAVCAHLNAFHVYVSGIQGGKATRVVESNHYCAHLSADVSFSSSNTRFCVEYRFV
jgi:hypothetical protein